MADLHLVTGYKGEPHITSANQGLFNANTIGSGDYVFNSGKKFESSIVDNNHVRIHDGSLMMNGRHITLDAGTYIDAVIENGTSGYKRHDIVVVRYEKAAATGIESAKLVVIKGTPSTGTPTDPTIPYTDSILDSAAQHDMVLYRVILDGFTITKVEPLFQLLAPMVDFQHGFYKQNMLINGDFQCNQRGLTTYDASSKSMYTVDMWRAFKVTVNVTNNGVKVKGTSTTEQGFFTQFIQLGALQTMTYTVSAMVDDTICTFTETPGATAKEKIFGKFKISMLTTSAWDSDLGDYNNKLKINICPVGTNEINIKYIDVFEGSTVISHKKEDYATALMRCEKYIKKKGYVSPIYQTILGMSENYNFVICLDRMANNFGAAINPPQLESYSWNFVGYNASTGATPTQSNNVSTPTTIDNTSGVVSLTTTSAIKRTEDAFGIKGTYVVTCEPRDS